MGPDEYGSLPQSEGQVFDPGSEAKVLKAQTFVIEHALVMDLREVSPEEPVVFRVENPVPVFALDDTVVGHATLEEEGGRVFATVFLDKESPERLSIETKSERLYAEPRFYLEFLDGRERFDLVVYELSITRDEPLFLAVPPLGEVSL